MTRGSTSSKTPRTKTTCDKAPRLQLSSITAHLEDISVDNSRTQKTSANYLSTKVTKPSKMRDILQDSSLIQANESEKQSNDNNLQSKTYKVTPVCFFCYKK